MNALQILLVALYPVFVSPVAMWVIRQKMEYGQPVGMFDPRTQSWAFMLGDTFSLPLTVWFALRAVRNPNQDVSLIHQWWWIPVAVLAGVAASLGFRVMDSAGYASGGHADRLNAPTKLWHDYAVYATVGALLCFVGVPALLTWSVDGFIALAFFGSWVAFGIRDGVHGLDPAHLHPRVQDTAFAKFFQ